jgi:undecaprenyl pyrophosphate phosphatase UppP
LSSYLTIKLFLSFISKFNLNIFIYYRIILGTFILLFL